MKKLLTICLIFFISLYMNGQQFGEFADKRDGKTYKIVQIKGQIWMAENLAYKPDIGNFWAFDDNKENITKYGYLYDWWTAQNVCPDGWRLPSKDDLEELEYFVGGKDVVGKKLKSEEGWKNNGNGVDAYGFAAMPGGYKSTDGSYYGLGENGHWWTSTEKDRDDAWYRVIHYKLDSWSRYSLSKELGMSVRCLRN